MTNEHDAYEDYLDRQLCQNGSFSMCCSLECWLILVGEVEVEVLG